MTPSRSRSTWVWTMAALAAIVLPRFAAADSVTLSWTAPGDDGTVGRATSYEMRYSDQPVAGQDTLSWWNGATSVGTMPVSDPAISRLSPVMT